MNPGIHRGLRTAYIGIGSRNPRALNDYLGRVIGLMPGASNGPGHSSWRCDTQAQRLWVQEATQDDALCLGFEAIDATAYDRALQRLAQAGVSVRRFDSTHCAARGVEAGVAMDTPWQVPLELVLGPAEVATPFASPLLPHGLVTGDQGFGHAVFIVGSEAAYQASRRFATEALGLALTDWLRMPLGDPRDPHRPQLQASFFHANARHHSLAIAYPPVPADAPTDAPAAMQRLHHINLEVPTLTDVGQAYDRALASRTPLANTIGQHDNDGMLSFYSIGPGGWRVEIGANGRHVGDDWQDVREYDRISAWGHQPPELLAAHAAAPPA